MPSAPGGPQRILWSAIPADHYSGFIHPHPPGASVALGGGFWRSRSRGRHRPDPDRAPQARAIAARVGTVHTGRRHAGCAVRRDAGGSGRITHGQPVLRGLADRIQPVPGQPVRLRPADRALSRARRAAQPGAAARHRHGPGAACRVHRRGRGCAEPVRLGAVHLRRDSAVHRGTAGLHQRYRARRRPAQTGQCRPKDLRPPADPAEQPGAVPRAGRRDRHHRPGVRAGLNPRRLRADPRSLHGVRGQRLRPARPAPPVLPDRRATGPAGVPVRGTVRHPGVHRVQADHRGPARLRGAPRGPSAGPAYQHRALAGRHRGRARRRHGDQPAGHPAQASAASGKRGVPGARPPGPARGQPAQPVATSPVSWATTSSGATFRVSPVTRSVSSTLPSARPRLPTVTR